MCPSVHETEAWASIGKHKQEKTQDLTVFRDPVENTNKKTQDLTVFRDSFLYRFSKNLDQDQGYTWFS